jgi:hypothetical protein
MKHSIVVQEGRLNEKRISWTMESDERVAQRYINSTQIDKKMSACVPHSVCVFPWVKSISPVFPGPYCCC